jgi:tetratricopeptide (TPR) repeat protein
MNVAPWSVPIGTVMRSFLLFGAILGVLAQGAAAQEGTPQRQAFATQHLRHGRYDEARRAFEELTKSLPLAERSPALLGLAETHLAVGNIDEALKLLSSAVEAAPADPLLRGQLAEVQFQTGDLAAARASAETAIQQHTDALRARLVLAHVDRETGRLDQALEGYRWFVRYYNREQPKDAESLRLVAEGSLEYARWKKVASVFHFVVNTLCPDALAADPDDWRVALLSGDLLLEKYNQSQAVPEFEAALKINPQAAEAHAALARAALQDHEPQQAGEHADRALAINKRQIEALLVHAEIALEREDADRAQEFVERALRVNSVDQRALACMAACLMLRDGYPAATDLDELLLNLDDAAKFTPKHPSEFTRLVLDLGRRNPRPGVFLNKLGEFIESRRKYALAEPCYRAAVKLMPQLAAPQTNLGLLCMRTGRVAEAEKILDDAFKADPFHVRVSNMRKVIGVLNDHEVITTEHFLIRVDGSDKLLGEAMAEYLEEVHAELVAQYGYEPPARTQFEVYSAAKGQTAHQWFSARMVGLPWIQTIGASTGMIVALASPNAVAEPFHWARVLKHEYVHILTLQQTDFNIPHWYTEALAVRTEGLKLPAEWQQLLLERVPAGEVYTLETVNRGFQQPRGPADWTMAYCQSRLYAQLIEEAHGAEALSKLVDAYRRGLSTDAAFREVCGVSAAEFDEKFRVFLVRLVAEIRGSQASPKLDVAETRTAFEADETNAAAAGRYAWALLQGDQDDAAEKMAEVALGIDSHDPFGSATAALLAREQGDSDKAKLLLETAHAAERLHPVVLALLAEQCFNAEEFARAAELYRLGTEKFPLEDAFWKGLIVAQLKREDNAAARPALAEMAARDSENVIVRRMLAQHALARDDFADAKTWAREMLYVDVTDAEAHSLLGRACEGLSEWDRGRKAYQNALSLDDKSIEGHLGLARLARRDRNAVEHKKHVDAALRIDPENEEALRLRGRTE